MEWVCLFCLFGFLTSSSTTRLHRGQAPRQSWETMTSVSAGHIILTRTQPEGSGRPKRESNPGPPHQESRALPTELPPPPPPPPAPFPGWNDMVTAINTQRNTKKLKLNATDQNKTCTLATSFL